MGRIRLRKKDRIAKAGKGNNLPQYSWSKPKRPDKAFSQTQMDGKPIKGV